MKIVEEGHVYELDGFDNSDNSSTVTFIKKFDEGSHDGTTNEEVLLMLIDRMNYLQEKMPCRENTLVITKLEEALHWLFARTSNRELRGVEGKNIK